MVDFSFQAAYKSAKQETESSESKHSVSSLSLYYATQKQQPDAATLLDTVDADIHI
jgi:hypothetical protein